MVILRTDMVVEKLLALKTYTLPPPPKVTFKHFAATYPNLKYLRIKCKIRVLKIQTLNISGYYVNDNIKGNT